MRSWLITSVLWMSAIAPVFGQGTGDPRVLLKDVELTIDGKVVGKLPAGSTVMILDTKDSLLFSGIGKTGWFPRESAVTLEQGLEYFSRAIDDNPRDARAFVGRGNIYFRQGDNAKAIVDYDQAIQLNAQDPEPFRWRGWSWKRQGDDSKALASLNEAIRLDPRDAPSWRIRGAVYSAQKDYPQCRVNYDRSIELDPFDADLFNHRAVLLGRCPDKSFRDPVQGLKDAIRACELASWKTPHYMTNLAVAYSQVSDQAQADNWLEQALKSASPDDRARLTKAIETQRETK